MATSSPHHAALPRWQRALLPGELLEGRRSARDWIVDVLMYLVAGALGCAVLATTWDDHSTAEAIADIALGVAALAALWFRRRHPVAVGLIAVGCSVIAAFAAGAGLVAVLNAAMRAPRRGVLAIAGLGLASTAISPLLYPGDDSYVTQLIVGTLVTGFVVGWGLFLRVQRELVLSLRERARRLEAEDQLRVEQAREAERRRIAREMHDVLAHRVSLLSLHAGALEFRPDAPADEVAQAAGVIRETAHAALEDLREVVGVLREGAPDGPPEPPQPTLADVPALIEESRRAGMHVECRIDVPASDDIPAALGRTAYRIVQEGLTNARKHAPAASVEVALTATDASLVVEVLSRRAVGVAAAARALPGGGTGLVGLAERVGLAGGELVHGPDGAGDFVLRATLPRG